MIMRYLFTLACLLLVTAAVANEPEFDFSSVAAKKALRDYEKAVAKDEKSQAQKQKMLDEDAAKEAKETRHAFVANLQNALKKSMQAGNLDEANKIDNAIKALKGGAKSSIDEAMGETSLPWKTQRKHLIGTWTWFNHTATFHKNGAVTSTFGNSGTWKRDNERIVITWESKTDSGNHHWDSFDFPIDPNGVIGDSWAGPGMIRSKKIK